MTLQSDFSLLQSGCAGPWFSSTSLLLDRGPVLWVCSSQGRPSRRRGAWASARSSVCWSLRSAFSGTAILIGCSDSADTAAGAGVVQVLRKWALLLFSGYFAAARKRLRRFETDLNSSQPPEYQAHQASASSPSLSWACPWPCPEPCPWPCLDHLPSYHLTRLDWGCATTLYSSALNAL